MVKQKFGLGLILTGAILFYLILFITYKTDFTQSKKPAIADGSMDSIVVDKPGVMIPISNQNYLIKEKAKYSSFYCRRRKPHSAQCIFSNVGYRDHSIIFYEDPENPVTFITQGIKYTFPKEFLGIRTAHHTETRDFVDIIKINEPVPTDAVYYPHKLSYLISSFWAVKFDHWVIDDMFASFSNALDLGFHMKDIPYVVDRGCMSLYPQQEKDRHRCTLFWTDHVQVFTKIAPLFLDQNSYQKESLDYDNNQVFSEAYQNRTMHFQNVIAGQSSYSIGYGSNRLSLYWKLFVQDMLKRTGIPDVLPKEHQITLIQKKGTRIIENFEEVVELAKKFSYKVYIMDPAKLSMIEQIQIMRNTTVFISVPGESSFCASFLNTPSVGLMIDIWDHYLNASAPLEAHWWEQLGAFQYYSYKYYLDEAIFPEAYDDPSKLTPRMKADLKLNKEEVTLEDMNDQAKYTLLRNYASVRVDLKKFNKTLCQLLHVAEANYGFARTVC